jgi:hypothetical protein
MASVMWWAADVDFPGLRIECERPGHPPFILIGVGIAFLLESQYAKRSAS